MKTQVIQLVKIKSSDIYDNIIPDTVILIKSNYDEMKFIVSSSFQKEEIKTEVKKEETANKTKKVIPKKTSSPKKTSDSSDKAKSKKSA